MGGLDALVIIAILAVMGEGVIEAIKPALKPLADRMPQGVDLYLYISLILGVLLALNWRADLFMAIGIDSAALPYVGSILTGIVIGRGANFAHDLVNRINKGGSNG